MRGSDNIKDIIKQVPIKLRQDPGFVFQLGLKYEKQNNYADLTKLLISIKNPTTKQTQWWQFKARVMRELFKNKNFHDAYLLAINHNNQNVGDYADAEWLAGWIALRFLDDAKTAQTHFHNLYQKVKYPISLARALYWLGRSYEKSHTKEALEYYKLASQHVETFYGQLAIIKLDEKHIILPKPIIPSIEDVKHHHRNELAKISWLFGQIGRHEYVKLFNKAAIESITSPGEMILVNEMSSKFGNLHVLVETAKHMSRQKRIFTDLSYPKLGHINVSNLEKPLVLSIIRQESVFDHLAVSSAGAMGLMQLMPCTAKALALELRKPYKNKEIFYDHAYHINLGTRYLRKLIDAYDNSYILAVAAYNAGQVNVDRWLEEYGDPRKENLEQVIDWLEIIPFYETRNYLHRVLENLQIYRLVSAKNDKDKELCLVKDLCKLR